ncbi:glycogen debranching protein GlgX [Algivirga pacifica]|uniref:Glycogen debranching protein GlgX n=2 Tax=Algivirga pacifica TaxID=1162670 RepID=A0ABP9DH34_9BACT
MKSVEIPTGQILHGTSYPLGATVQKRGTNFSIFSTDATKVELLFFEDKDSVKPSRVITLNPEENKTFYYWHVFVEGVGHGQVYAYRVHGPYNPEQGLYFDKSKLLLDPYAKAIYLSPKYNRKAATRPGDNSAHAPKSIVVDDNDYSWEGDRPLYRPYAKTVIYEMHVGGFTKHASSGISEELKGTFAGVKEKIPYLKELGVTAVELLPVQQFDPYDAPENKTNYWGYSPLGFFAPHHAYGTNPEDPTQVVREFKDMVKALHKEGIEVILDVVYNHTAEVHAEGPTLCYRGLANPTYYMLDEENQYRDFTGCGNTLNANHSIVRRMIMDSLRYWVSEMHVDGFRFDLASVLSRGEDGEPLKNPPILWEIESDPVLAGAKMIAEAWDASGLYQVGNFIGDKWSEWNGVFRDTMRRFVKSDGHVIHDMMDCVEASHKMYHAEGRDPNRSINFVTCHDGFTLNDLVSYNQKHNMANGEMNRDGHGHNLSWNCGVEGPTVKPDVEVLRKRQIKNFFCMLLLSQGTPMISMGDEVRRSQHGNNNAYCQDNSIAWFNWEDVERHQDLYQFVKKLIKFNLSHDVFQREVFWSSNVRKRLPIITWHGAKDFDTPDTHPDSRSISFMLTDTESKEQIYVMLNAFWESQEFEVPEPSLDVEHTHFCRIIDTHQNAPYDILDEQQAPVITESTYRVGPRSIVVLKAV